MKDNQLWAERHKLIDQLPLKTPLGVHVCPSTYCNFRCEYCPHVKDDDGKGKLSPTVEFKMMSIDTFARIIDQIKCFPEKVKCLNFAWWGEPLTNPKIVEMVSYAKRMDIAECISITTNGALLTKSMSDGLISAGLDRIRISLQGLNSDTYKRVAGVSIDFDEFVDNIRYFYSHKDHTEVYIKIIDSLVAEQDQNILFHELFDDISDYINVEYLEPLQNDLDIDDLHGLYEKNYYGGCNIVAQKICSYCFYQIIISPEGIIYPCCSIDYEMNAGTYRDIRLSNIWEESLADYWMGEKLKEFRMKQIAGNRFDDPICQKCQFPKYHIADEDRLDFYQDKLKEIYY